MFSLVFAKRSFASGFNLDLFVFWKTRNYSGYKSVNGPKNLKIVKDFLSKVDFGI